MIHRPLARLCAGRSKHIAHVGRIIGWSGWAALLFGVLHKSAAPDALARFDLPLAAWWIPENIPGFLAAAAAILGGVALWACATHGEHDEGKNA